MIRVLVADDSSAVRDGLSSLLNRQADVEVIGMATDGLGAIDGARSLRPDLVIMDVRMPGLDGIEATRAIKSRSPGTGVLLFSAFGFDPKEALAAGADGYLLKDCDPKDLLSELRRIAALRP